MNHSENTPPHSSSVSEHRRLSPFVIATVLPFVTGGRRLGDIFANTRVVRVKPPEVESMGVLEERETEKQTFE